MKLIHLSDLHLGKRVNEYSMIEDQAYILKTIMQIITAEKPDGVIIAGDVYDKSVPTAEAVTLLDEFITNLSQKGIQTFIISGNHDSAERIAFGGKIMNAGGIHMSRVYDGKEDKYVLKDEFGEVNIYMLPFIKPINVKILFPEEAEEIKTYTDAIKTAIGKINVDYTKRNVLITHQFITNSERTESEEVSVGGTDNVDANVIDQFDYVALGHIHKPQNCGSKNIRYCGTPLKYSFSEAKDEKSVTVVQMGEKGELSVKFIPLVPKRDMKEIKGKYDEIMSKNYYEGTTLQEDYTHITLTDEDDVPDAVAKLRCVYKNLMKLDYDNKRTRTTTKINESDAENKTPLELIAELYEKQNGTELSREQTEYLTEKIEKIIDN